MGGGRLSREGRASLVRVAAVLVGALALAGCVEEVAGFDPNAPSSVRVTRVEGDPGSAEAPLVYGDAPVRFVFDVEVLARDGRVLDGWNGSLRVSTRPGGVADVSGVDGIVQRNVPMVGGRAAGVVVDVTRAFGRARVWFEDVGFVPVDPASAACANGIDDDGDGHSDHPDDFGCAFANDGDEGEGSGAAGVSDTLFFANPTLGDVQGYRSISPLTNESVTVDRGVMVVTRVTTDGFMLTDIDSSSVARGYNHLFAFNFSTPQFLRVCDEVLDIQGIVTEFFGYTELGFPSWSRIRYEDETLTPCRVPTPTSITAERLMSAAGMESLEAGLVRVDDGTIASRFSPELAPAGSNCDLNGDGGVSFDGPEGDCSDACALDSECSEWNQFVEFGQWSVLLAPGGPKIYVVSRDDVPDFDPYRMRGQPMRAVSGTLRHVEFLDPAWIIEPRCAADIVVDGEPAPSNVACVEPRTGGPDEPE